MLWQGNELSGVWTSQEQDYISSASVPSHETEDGELSYC